MLTVRFSLPNSPRCGSHVIRSAKRRCTWRHSSRDIQPSIAPSTSRGVPENSSRRGSESGAGESARRIPRSSGTLIRVLSSASA